MSIKCVFDEVSEHARLVRHVHFFCKKKIHTITNHAFCSFSDNLLNRRFARVANPDQPINGGQHCPFPSTSRPYFIVQLLIYWREACHRLSLQFQVMSKYLLQQTQKRKNLALSLLTGLRKKRTKFLKRRRQNLVRCGYMPGSRAQS